MNFLGLIFILTCLPSALIDFAMPIWKTEPAMQMEDAYKWIYQATRGGEHAAPDREMAKQWLDAEWKTLFEPMAHEPIWQPLCEDGSIGRLNLRPYKQRGGNPDDLVDAFVAGAKEFKGTEADFLAAWNGLGNRLKKRAAGSLSHKQWKTLDTAMKAKNYPAIHHSERYNKALIPAYRILPAGEMKKLIEKAKLTAP
jgi:hypothetical protein